MPIPANKAIVGSGAFAHSSGIHQDGVLKNRENYEIMTPESIGLNQIQLNLTSRSGRAAVKHRMDEMGYKESEYNLDNLYDAFLKLADKKGQVFDYDLEALALIGKQQEEPEHFRLDYFSVQSGSNDIATAAVKLACGEEVKAEAANGNGPVDAVYQAINRITDYNVELVKYSLTAKGHGKDALGQVDIVANYNGRRFPRRRPGHRYCRVLRQSHGARTEQYLARRRSRKRVATQSSTQRKQQGNRVMSKNYHIARIAGGRYWSGSDDPGAESAGCRAQPLCDAHHHQPLRCRRRSH